MNNSKQTILSIVGIAILVIAVVGVSFAFFSYSRNGTTNNTLSTGSVIFQFTEGQAIKLSNQFPIPDSQGAGLTSSVTGDNPTLTFHAIGYDGSTKGITYTITAYEGQAVDGKTARLNDSGIKLYLDATGATGNLRIYVDDVLKTTINVGNSYTISNFNRIFSKLK